MIPASIKSVWLIPISMVRSLAKVFPPIGATLPLARLLLIALTCTTVGAHGAPKCAAIVQPCSATHEELPVPTQSSAATQQTPSASTQSKASDSVRGTKLILKDGNYQLVRSYERNGDRVRYLSAERGDWEEIPASMVDWEATTKAAAAEQKSDDALLKKVHAQEEANRTEAVLDVDASLRVGQGVFLPPGEGMFAVEGKSVTPLVQVGAVTKTDKKRLLEQLASPVPIVPGKKNVEIPGAHAKIRISKTPEFYLREAPPDPDRTTPIARSSRPGESGPEVVLVRATVKGNKRLLESIKNFFGQDVSNDMNVIGIERWEVAPTVFRFTLSESLPSGEYALAEILPDGLNYWVWDFGVDAAGDAAAPASPSGTAKKP